MSRDLARQFAPGADRDTSRSPRGATWMMINSVDRNCLPSFVAGLDPATNESQEPIVEIIPIWILSKDQSNFPRAAPTLHIPLALPRQTHLLVAFGIDKPTQAVLLLSETADEARTMLPGQSRKVIRDATG